MFQTITSSKPNCFTKVDQIQKFVFLQLKTLGKKNVKVETLIIHINIVHVETLKQPRNRNHVFEHS